MTANALPSIFTIEIGATPTLTFEAQNLREAHELCHEQWLKDDLAEAKSDGAPLWDGRAKLRARMALPVLWNRICWRYRILLGRAEIVASGCGCVRRCPGLLGPAVASYSRSRGPGRCSDACRCTAGARAALSEGTEWQNESRYRRHSYD